MLMEYERTAREQLGCADTDPLIRQIRLLSHVWSDDVFHYVERRISQLRHQREKMPLHTDRTPVPGALDGALCLGTVPSAAGSVPLLFPPDRLTRHALIAGLPGVGKTFLARLLLASLVAKLPEVRIIVLDPNRSYTSVLAVADWLHVNWRDLRLNPLFAPEGVGPDHWRTQFSGIFGQGELLHARHFIARRLDDLYAKSTSRGVVSPSLYELRDDLRYRTCKYASADERYRQTALNVLDGLLRNTHPVFDCVRGMESLLRNTRVCIDTCGLSPRETLTYTLTHLIHYTYTVRSLAPLVEPPQLHTLVLVEEAQSLLERNHDRLAFYQELLLRSRAVGLGFLFLCQDISRIDTTVLAAVSNYFVFAQSSRDNKTTVAKLLDLSSTETEQLSLLGVGDCLVRFIGHPHFPHSFHGRIHP